MKRLILLLGILTMTYSISNAWDVNSVYKNNVYVAGSTVSDLILSSTTLNFYVTDMSYAMAGATGDFALVKSSFSNTTSDTIYVSPSIFYESGNIQTPIQYVNTAKKINIDLTGSGTFYYVIRGVR